MPQVRETPRAVPRRGKMLRRLRVVQGLQAGHRNYN